MIPPRPTLPTDRRQNGVRFQLNRLFDSREEIQNHLAQTYGNRVYRIINTFEVRQLACVIELEDEQKTKGKK